MDERKRTAETAEALPPKRRYLLPWFKIATKGLCDDARARIWKELLHHYGDAVEAHMEEGVPKEEAKKRAVAALGHPKKARRAFLKTYLTRNEARLLDAARTRLNKALTWVFVALPILFAPWIWESFNEDPLRETLAMTGAVALYSLAGATSLLAQRFLGKRGIPVRNFTLMAAVIVSSSLTVHVSDSSLYTRCFFAACWLPCLLMASRSFFSLWRKLGNEENKA